jgi:hypothetical protein
MNLWLVRLTAARVEKSRRSGQKGSGSWVTTDRTGGGEKGEEGEGGGWTGPGQSQE